MFAPMSIPSPDVQYILIGSFPIYIYALCIVSGVILAGIWTERRLRHRGGDRGATLDFLLWSLILGIIGARLYHVLTHWGDYFGDGKDLINVFDIRQGGIAIFGALLGGALGVFIASRLTGIRFLSFADALVPGLLIAQAVGRLGNWFNHELFGGPTTLPWGLEIESSNPAFPIGLPEGTLFHPTFLYESLWNLLGIFVLLSIEKKFRLRWGKFFALYLMWYGVGRAAVESLRVDPSMTFLGLRTNVLAALIAIVLGVVLFFVQRRKHVGVEHTVYLPGRKRPGSDVLESTSDADAFYHVIDRVQDHQQSLSMVAASDSDSAAPSVPAASESLLEK